MDNIFIVIFT